jgi:8-oxo-dGTP pyrophosphatase MutT (NUDIX family)
MRISPEEIEMALNSPLPGRRAHDEISSYVRTTAKEARKFNPPPRESAVLMLLYPHQESWNTVLILRPGYDGVHSNQVAFPGGGRETQDGSLIDTALREAEEELAIPRSETRIIGELSELYIPPSNYVVQPFVGITHRRPDFVPDQREVERIIENPIDPLFDKGIVKEKPIHFPTRNLTLNVKYFDIGNEVVWGATAMILSEFRMALEHLFDSPE